MSGSMEMLTPLRGETRRMGLKKKKKKKKNKN